MAGKKGAGIGFYLVYGFFYLIALLPFWVLYLLSDLMFVLIYHVARYRRKVVHKNLVNSFPEKDVKEIKAIEREFYRHFGDYFVETIKLLRVSEKEIRKRMVFTNPEVVNDLSAEGKTCFMSMGHYANWEWVTSMGLQLLPEAEQGLIYKRLSSRAFDELFLEIRSLFRPRPIEMRSIYRTIIQNRKEGRVMVIGFLNDQRPRPHKDEHWVTFLNQETLTQTGMERIAAQSGYAVVYLDLKKVKRGHYEGTYSLITKDASQEGQYFVTDMYTKKLEETIKRDPAYYLWTHNKWSRKRRPEMELKELSV